MVDKGLPHPGQDAEQVIEPSRYREVHVGFAVQDPGSVDEHEPLHIAGKAACVEKRDGAAHGMADQVEPALHARSHQRMNEFGIALGRVEIMPVGRPAKAGQIEGDDVVARGQRWQNRMPVARAAVAQAMNQHHGRRVGRSGLHDVDLPAEIGRVHHLAAVARQGLDRFGIVPHRLNRRHGTRSCRAAPEAHRNPGEDKQVGAQASAHIHRLGRLTS